MGPARGLPPGTKLPPTRDLARAMRWQAIIDDTYGVTALPADLSNVVDTGFVCENSDREAYGESIGAE